MQVSLLPDYDRTNGWLEILGPQPEPRVLDGAIDTDYLVVGAGYGGLAAARRLAELHPNKSVALVEADRLGNNAAGRCSGFIIDHAHNIRAKGFADDPTKAKRGIASNRIGLDWLSEIVARENINCDWSPQGKIHAAATEGGRKMLGQFAKSLDAVDEDYSMVDAGELARAFGTNFYNEGLHAPHSVLAQPAALVIGLATTMPSNVTVYENSPITGYDWGAPHRLTTPQGSITTPTVAITANGFGQGFGLFSNHLLPLVTWGSMTRELTDKELERLGGEDSYGIIPAHPAGTTVRRLPDRRILIRNQYTYSATSNIKKGKWAVFRTHRSSFENRFPMLKDVPFQFTWGGALSLSRNGAGVCGEMYPGVWSSMVYQGVGMARGTTSGKYLAEMIAGESPEYLDVLTTGATPSRNFPDPFNRWGVRLNARWRRHQAGIEE